MHHALRGMALKNRGINLREFLLYVLAITMIAAWAGQVVFAFDCIIDDDGGMSCSDSIND